MTVITSNSWPAHVFSTHPGIWSGPAALLIYTLCCVFHHLYHHFLGIFFWSVLCAQCGGSDPSYVTQSCILCLDIRIPLLFHSWNPFIFMQTMASSRVALIWIEFMGEVVLHAELSMSWLSGGGFVHCFQTSGSGPSKGFQIQSEWSLNGHRV